MAKIKKILVFFAFVLFLSAAAGTAFSMTDSERQTMIANLKQQLLQLQSQLAQLISQQTGQSWCHTFNGNLGYTSSGSSEVVALHIALQKENISYSPDAVATYGTGTALAVTQFQEKYKWEILSPLGLSRGTGYVAQATRKKLNELYGCNNYTTCTPSWSCGYWSNCSSGHQARICTDINACGKNTNKPSESQSCSSSTNNTNCSATCVIQNNENFAIDCDGDVTKCASGYYCEKIYDTDYEYSSGSVATYKTLTGTHCVKSSSSTCTPDWDCGSWSSCSSGHRTRSCTDSHSCSTTTGRPDISETCSTTCTPSWHCSSWTSCYNSQHSRTCSDYNNCGVEQDRPDESETCSTTCTPSWSCSSWESCVSGQRERDCNDNNNCGIESGRPDETESCVCAPEWSCGSWGSCINNSHSRTCEDENDCDTTSGRPNLTESCISPPSVDIKANNLDDLTISDTGPVNLSWTSVNVAFCTASQDWSGAKSTSGSETSPKIYSFLSFTISCTGPYGSADDTVTISTTANYWVDLKVNNLDSVTIDPHTALSFSWTSLNVSTCNGLGLGGLPWHGTAVINPPTSGFAMGQKTYSIRCTATTGDTTVDSVDVTVQ